jgi:hypothetical protein
MPLTSTLTHVLPTMLSPIFIFHPLSNCSKKKKKTFDVCWWCPSWCPFYLSSHPSSSFISPLSSHIIGPSLVCSFFTLSFFVVGFIYQLVFFLFVISTQHPQHPNHLFVFKKTLLHAFSFLRTAIIIT